MSSTQPHSNSGILSKRRPEDIPDFDFARHLDTKERMAAYLDAVLEDNDMQLLCAALGLRLTVPPLQQATRV